jgi:hypothetical protein
MNFGSTAILGHWAINLVEDELPDENQTMVGFRMPGEWGN